MTVDDMPRLKLSEAAAVCGIPTDVLAMARDGLFPQVVRGKSGHLYSPPGRCQPGANASGFSRKSEIVV